MNPDHYCRDRVAPAGSSLHYSLLTASEDNKRAAIALHALAQSLLYLSTDGDETLPAVAKLDWWRDEIERMFAAEPRHPTTRALAPHIVIDAQSTGLFGNLLEASRGRLEQPTPPDRKALEQYQALAVDSITRLQVALHGGRIDRASDPLLQLARFTDLVVQIRDIGRHARRGVVYFPLADLDQHAVGVQDLSANEPNPALKSFLTSQSESAMATYDDAAAKVDSRQLGEARLPLVTLAKLRLQLLREISASGFRVLDRRLELTPIRKFWIAVRTR